LPAAFFDPTARLQRSNPCGCGSHARTPTWRARLTLAEQEAHKDFDNGPYFVPLAAMNEYAFVGLVTIAITLFAMGVMDILAVAITTPSNLL
jgi:hypothetical protein